MKVAYVLGTFPSLSETFILREIVELRRQGVEIDIFALRRPVRGPMHAEADGLLAFTTYRPPILGAATVAAAAYFLLRHPIRLMRVLGWALAPRAPVEWLRCLRNVPAAAFFARRALAAGVRHVHAHFAFAPADVACMMAGFTGLPFSFSGHARDIYCQSAALLRRKVRAARFVVVCTRYGGEELARRTGLASPGPVHVVYHGVEAAAGNAVHGNEPVILSVGRLEPKKGFGTLVEACRLLRDRGVTFRCVVAGEGPERRNIDAAIGRCGLGGTVRLVGAQTQEQVAALLRAARVFALPCTVAADGDRDSLPNAILEALAAGVPVVTTPVAGIPEAIDDGRTGFLVPPDDAAALAASLEELLKNDALCRTIRSFGRTAVAERFDLVRNVAALAALFEQGRKTA